MVEGIYGCKGFTEVFGWKASPIKEGREYYTNEEKDSKA